MPAFFVFVVLAATTPPDMDAFFKAADGLSRKTINDAPRVISEMRERNNGRAAAYEKRIAALKEGRDIAVPLLPHPPKPGGVGALPAQLRVVKILDAREMIVEGFWMGPQPDFVGPAPSAEQSGSTPKARMVVKNVTTDNYKVGQIISLPGVHVATDGSNGAAVSVSRMGASAERLAQMLKEWRDSQTRK